jgi:hypothetical protein
MGPETRWKYSQPVFVQLICTDRLRCLISHARLRGRAGRRAARWDAFYAAHGRAWHGATRPAGGPAAAAGRPDTNGAGSDGGAAADGAAVAAAAAAAASAADGGGLRWGNGAVSEEELRRRIASGTVSEEEFRRHVLAREVEVVPSPPRSSLSPAVNENEGERAEGRETNEEERGKQRKRESI